MGWKRQLQAGTVVMEWHEKKLGVCRSSKTELCYTMGEKADV